MKKHELGNILSSITEIKRRVANPKFSHKPVCAIRYFALAGGTIPFIRKYSTIWP